MSADRRFGADHIDPRVTEYDHHHSQYERCAAVAVYHRYVLRRTVRMADLKDGMSVLDYGCGGQMLKAQLPSGVKYTGYDVNPRFSSIPDPSGGSYDVVFAIQMMQYPDRAGLDALTTLFASISPRVVIMVPSVNAFKKHVVDRMFGRKAVIDSSFRSLPQDVYSAIGRLFQLRKFRRLFPMAEFSLWERRDGS